MTDISDIFEMENAKDTKQKTEKKSRKKKDYTEEEKQKIKERLKLGKVKAAEAREQKKNDELTNKTIENKEIKHAKQTPVEIREKLITKHILELEEADGIDPKELKQFLSKLYKASKQKHVQDAMNNYDKPQPEPTPKPKQHVASIPEKHPEPSQIIPPKPKEPPKPSKEELEEKAYQERMAKLKKQLANKKRR